MRNTTLLSAFLLSLGFSAHAQPLLMGLGPAQIGMASLGGAPEQGKRECKGKGHKLKMLAGALMKAGLEKEQVKEVIKNLVEAKIAKHTDTLRTALQAANVDADKIDSVIEKITTMKREKMMHKLDKGNKSEVEKPVAPEPESTEDAEPSAQQCRVPYVIKVSS